MIENGFYKIKTQYLDLIERLGGTYRDNKERPVLCCIEDKYINGLFYAIPTSDLSHRNDHQIEKIERLVGLPDRDIRSSWYHIGHTNKPAIYKISNCLPLSNKYIDCEYISKGKHLILADKKEIAIIRRKLARILFAESKNHNKFEQHITDIRNYVVGEMEIQQAQQEAAPTED